MILTVLLLSVWGRCPAGRGEQTLRCAQLSAQLSAGQDTFYGQYTFYGPWIESFQDCWWDPEFPQLSQMVQSLPGFINLCLNVCSPSQVLWDVYTKVLEAAHPLHRGPTYLKRSVGPLLSLLPLFHQGSSSAGSEPEPNFKPVLCLSTPKAPAPNQQKRFVSSTKTLLG